MPVADANEAGWRLVEKTRGEPRDLFRVQDIQFDFVVMGR
jgi:hypothetical protein